MSVTLTTCTRKFGSHFPTFLLLTFHWSFLLCTGRGFKNPAVLDKDDLSQNTYKFRWRASSHVRLRLGQLGYPIRQFSKLLRSPSRFTLFLLILWFIISSLAFCPFHILVIFETSIFIVPPAGFLIAHSITLIDVIQTASYQRQIYVLHTCLKVCFTVPFIVFRRVNTIAKSDC
jgi:hypothetical protein